MYAAHAALVSAIRVAYYSAVNARTMDEAAAIANRNEAPSTRFEEAAIEDVADDSAIDDDVSGLHCVNIACTKFGTHERLTW